MTTQINHPDYYRAGKYEAADYIEAFNLNFNLGNVIKYVTRAGRKDDNALTDLKKAHNYLEREIKRLTPDTDLLVVRPEITD